MSLVSIIVFVLIFGLVVLIHELGHFWAARRLGVGVDEFGLGMPPRIWGKKIGETIYSLNWIPFGGFVRLQGEGEEEPLNPSRSLRRKGFWARLTVIIAGVVMNFLLAYVLIAIGFWMGMPPLSSDPVQLAGDATRVDNSVVVVGVEDNSPAKSAGILPGDVVVRVGDTDVISAKQLQDEIARSARPVRIGLLRSDEEVALSIEPKVFEGRQIVGVFTRDAAKTVDYVWWQVPWLAGQDFVATVGYVSRGVLGFFGDLFTTGKLSEDITGPLGIAQITGRVVELGFLTVLQFVAMLSINLGFVNILPIPALDGGRMVILIVESLVPSRRWNYRVEAGVHSIGFILLFILIVLVTYKDIVRIF